MNSIEIKPYLLKNPIQNYSWGTKNEKAFIPKLLGLTPEKDKPYAELWMGTHPNAPSYIKLESGKMELQKFINTNPEAILGKEVAKRFSNRLPFLFKVLSAAEALSIQAHPDKAQAEMLHKKDPANYPDDNHKPEIAIALDNLTALIGFRPFTEIISVFDDFPGLKSFINKDFFDQIVADFKHSGNESVAISQLYSMLSRNVDLKKNEFDQTINSIREKISPGLGESNLREKLFLELNTKYGSDIGLISLYLLNLVQLKKGQGVFLKAGIPHAYLEGNIVECMANSDNVVRAGLTPKFQDADALLQIMTYKSGIPGIFTPARDSKEFIYEVPVPEFKIKYMTSEPQNSITQTIHAVQVLLVIEGEINIITGNTNLKIKRGDSLIIPASVNQYNINFIKNSQLFIASAAV